MNEPQRDAWRELMTKTGLSLARDAQDERADPMTLIERTKQALSLLMPEAERIEEERLRRTT